ncbi:hypothetical protein M422DRAFT_27992 [Sphaerobolus stellatus SS14]|nr:hypothetical protein M422DRAFT_27992 [Sphaerobolus stellatus SS14]
MTRRSPSRNPLTIANPLPVEPSFVSIPGFPPVPSFGSIPGVPSGFSSILILAGTPTTLPSESSVSTNIVLGAPESSTVVLPFETPSMPLLGQMTATERIATSAEETTSMTPLDQTSGVQTTMIFVTTCIEGADCPTVTPSTTTPIATPINTCTEGQTDPVCSTECIGTT